MTKQKSRLKIPALLLEGDEPPQPAGAMPGRDPKVGVRFGTAPAQHTAAEPQPKPLPAPPKHAGPEPAALPETYGTGKLLLVARDPHCLYTHWDIPPEEQRHYNQLSASHHLVVRVHPDATGSTPANEIDVHPESRHCFVPVEQAAARYVVELGYYRPDGQWKSINTSPPATTPPDTVSDDKALRFASIPGRAPNPAAAQAQPLHEDFSPQAGFSAAPRVLAPILPPRVSWIPALETFPPAFPEIPAAARDPANPPIPLPPAQWTSEAERAFAEAAGHVLKRQRSIDSLSVVELSSVQLPAGISSQFGGEQLSLPGFWFQLNAELIIYGATEPDASVTIAGRPIQLRPDGSFSCRFTLPDGGHQLPVVAISSRGDRRQAELNFTRRTHYHDPTAPESGSAAP